MLKADEEQEKTRTTQPPISRRTAADKELVKRSSIKCCRVAFNIFQSIAWSLVLELAWLVVTLSVSPTLLSLLEKNIIRLISIAVDDC